MVTHEPDIAAHAKRVIRFHDGRVVDDHSISKPRDAAQELVVMPLIEDATSEMAGVK